MAYATEVIAVKMNMCWHIKWVTMTKTFVQHPTYSLNPLITDSTSA